MTALSDTQWDHIIVGGGTAGCILANRLSADPSRRVLLLEAGGTPNSPWIGIPAGFYKLLTNPRYNWMFRTEPEEATGNRVIAVPRGKGLGGSTLINGMIYVIGQPQDYDGWAQRGCTGWSHADVAPVFRAIEDFRGPDPDNLRGHGGPLPISVVAERPAIAEAFIEAAIAAGHSRSTDYNGATQDGFGYYQVNQARGRRVSAADAWLAPARARFNLRVETDISVTGLRMDGRRVTGVDARRNGDTIRIDASRDVILAAGGIQSPHLLEVSGIGDPEVLHRAGIPLRHALPGVGANYLDHFCTRMNWRVTQRGTLNDRTRGLPFLRELLRYGLRREGILTLGTGLAHGFVRTREGLDGPDVQFFFMHASYANAAERKLDRLPGMTIGVTQLRPQSRGTIHAVGPGIDRMPAIRPNFLAEEEDRRAMVEGMKIARQIVAQRPMSPFRGAELSPGASCTSDADWLAFARANGQTIYHVAGTCRMGNDPGAVVDPQLRVHGLSGLRVIDASIMPTMVSGNTQAAVMMIAEKGAAFILNA